MTELCPCNSGVAYASCCGACHNGRPANTPEALMRSRYSAYTLNLPDYLLATWHPDTRPQTLQLGGGDHWCALHVLSSAQQGDIGNVHFRAIYRTGNGFGFLEERSSFSRLGERWYYLAGDTTEGKLKPGRNEVCPCGSGRKTKTCCGR